MSKDFGKFLKELREQKELSINQLALKSGVSAPQISRIETGTRGVPKPETIKKLSTALDISSEEMMNVAGYIDTSIENEVPNWANSKDKRDFKKMLEEDSGLMFDGVPIEDEDRQRIMDILTGLFWDAKHRSKEKYTNNRYKKDNSDLD
ncbi:helix-turn-helix domain-containing protein [Paenibacillus terrigena]|uniref:helix-turn-helix domain-containing protein n=1 Tax=Paenibacillus terrigena TaxID=369333 RepID=UPI00036BCD39|nr:helix-turn-helix transcriptional regulator [Paenibacillus terrigena]